MKYKFITCRVRSHTVLTRLNSFVCRNLSTKQPIVQCCVQNRKLWLTNAAMKRHRRTWSMNMNLASPLSLGLDPAYDQHRRHHCLLSYSAVSRRRSSFSSRRCSYVARSAAPCHVHITSLPVFCSRLMTHFFGC